MDAIKRIELEMQSHRRAIDEHISDLKHLKSELKRILNKISKDEKGENDAENYGFIYSISDRICTHIKSIKDLQNLIFLKMDIYVKSK